MPWMSAATVLLDRDGRYLDADAAALDLLGLGSVEELRSTPPEQFAAVPPDPVEQEAWRRAYFASRAEGVLAEGAFRRTDGELVRVRTAILEEGDGRFRALFYPIERPTTDISARVYRISDVLAEWRGAERRLVELPADSEEARRVEADIARLREQYQAISRRRMRSEPER
jgi:PAS domain-containing protein